MTKRLLIIGNGMASVRLAEALMHREREASARRFAVTVVGAETEAGYNRCLLYTSDAADE